MDSNKVVVWVTNQDTERNGSSLTTRDGTSYPLADTLMFACDHGQSHIFSGYCYTGVDDGAPGTARTPAPDVTRPTDDIETAGTRYCTQHWTATCGTIGFRNAVAGIFTATVVKDSVAALYAGTTFANWAGTRKYDPSDPTWSIDETSYKGDDITAKSIDPVVSVRSGGVKSEKAMSDTICRAVTLVTILSPVVVGVTFMAIARRNGKAQPDNSGPNND